MARIRRRAVKFRLWIVAAVLVGDGWACYAWSFNSRNFTLIDPSANGMSVQDVKKKHRHAYEPLFAKLLMHASPAVRDAAWTEVIHVSTVPGAVVLPFD
jgi:hypothetical protein